MDVQMVEYLKNVVDLEKSVYTQTQMIQRIMNRMMQLGKKKSDPKGPPALKESEGDMKHVGAGCTLGSIIGLFAGLLIDGFPEPSGILGFALGGVIGAVIGAVIMHRKKNEENEYLQLMYGKELARYNEEKKNEEARIRKEQVEQQQLNEALRFITAKRKDTAAVLGKFYSMNIIYPKYQNFTAVSSFYEYFSSGRCTTLEGHEGAYNIYENEVRLGLILTKLDIVVQKLEQIKNSQYILYDALSEGNRISQQLADATVQQARLMRSVADNTELAAYYSRQTVAEANQMKWLMLCEAWNGK